jgi:hypothetical protein
MNVLIRLLEVGSFLAQGIAGTPGTPTIVEWRASPSRQEVAKIFSQPADHTLYAFYLCHGFDRRGRPANCQVERTLSTEIVQTSIKARSLVGKLQASNTDRMRFGSKSSLIMLSFKISFVGVNDIGDCSAAGFCSGGRGHFAPIK